jgi:hypothetical protein
MNRLIAYLRQRIIVDFEGYLDLGTARGYLGEDTSSDAQTLLGKLVDDSHLDDMMTLLADRLSAHIRRCLTDDVLREQLRTYFET